MPSTEIEEFAKILILEVRDAAIRSCDRSFDPNAADPISKRWREAAASSRTSEAFARVLIPDIVDSTISHLLGAIDQELLQLSFSASNGDTVNLAAEGVGELSGWFRGHGGWCEKYSNERFVDDFADLK